MEIGIRELRADLSRFLKRVQEGDEVVVTDRGTAVARIVPVSGERKIDRLVAAGLVERAPRPWRGPPPSPAEASGTVSDLVSEQRR